MERYERAQEPPQHKKGRDEKKEDSGKRKYSTQEKVKKKVNDSEDTGKAGLYKADGDLRSENPDCGNGQKGDRKRPSLNLRRDKRKDAKFLRDAERKGRFEAGIRGGGDLREERAPLGGQEKPLIGRRGKQVSAAEVVKGEASWSTEVPRGDVRDSGERVYLSLTDFWAQLLG